MPFIFNLPITICLMPWYIQEHLSCGSYIVEKFNLKMKLLKSEKAKFAFGLILIILIYSCYYIYILENKSLCHFCEIKISMFFIYFYTFFLGLPTGLPEDLYLFA